MDDLAAEMLADLGEERRFEIISAYDEEDRVILDPGKEEAALQAYRKPLPPGDPRVAMMEAWNKFGETDPDYDEAAKHLAVTKGGVLHRMTRPRTELYCPELPPASSSTSYHQFGYASAPQPTPLDHVAVGPSSATTSTPPAHAVAKNSATNRHPSAAGPPPNRPLPNLPPNAAPRRHGPPHPAPRVHVRLFEPDDFMASVQATPPSSSSVTLLNTRDIQETLKPAEESEKSRGLECSKYAPKAAESKQNTPVRGVEASIHAPRHQHSMYRLFPRTTTINPAARPSTAPSSAPAATPSYAAPSVPAAVPSSPPARSTPPPPYARQAAPSTPPARLTPATPSSPAAHSAAASPSAVVSPSGRPCGPMSFDDQRFDISQSKRYKDVQEHEMAAYGSLFDGKATPPTSPTPASPTPHPESKFRKALRKVSPKRLFKSREARESGGSA